MELGLVTEQDFEARVLRNPLPVLLDLYADWCEPCKQLLPVLEGLADELQGKVEFLRVNVETSPALGQAFRVQSIPMLVLLKDGRPVDQRVGAVDKRMLLEMLRPVIPASSEEVEPAALAQLLSAGRVLAVDVRDANSYGRYHVPGAIHVPAAELTTRLDELAPTDGRLRVLYGRTTDDGRLAVDAARAAGAQVGLLVGGFLHWEADGNEVERG